MKIKKTFLIENTQLCRITLKGSKQLECYIALVAIIAFEIKDWVADCIWLDLNFDVQNMQMIKITPELLATPRWTTLAVLWPISIQAESRTTV